MYSVDGSWRRRTLPELCDFCSARGRVATVVVSLVLVFNSLYLWAMRRLLCQQTGFGALSITVDVSVYAQRGLRDGGEEICIKVTEAVLTMFRLRAAQTAGTRRD